MGALRKSKISGTILAGTLAVIAVLAFSGYDDPQKPVMTNQQYLTSTTTIVEPIKLTTQSITQSVSGITNNVEPQITSQNRPNYVGSGFIFSILQYVDGFIDTGAAVANVISTTYTLPTSDPNVANLALDHNQGVEGFPKLYMTYSNAAKIGLLTPNDDDTVADTCSVSCPDPTVKEWNIPSGNTAFGLHWDESLERVFFTEPTAPGKIGMLNPSSNDFSEWSLSGVCPNSSSDCEPRGITFLSAVPTPGLGNTDSICWAEAKSQSLACLSDGNDDNFGTSDDQITHWNLSGLGISGSNQPYDVASGGPLLDSVQINGQPGAYAIYVISQRSPNPPAIIGIQPVDGFSSTCGTNSDELCIDSVYVWIAPSGTADFIEYDSSHGVFYFAADSKIVRFEPNCSGCNAGEGEFTEWTIPSGVDASSVGVKHVANDQDTVFFNISSGGQGVGVLDTKTGFFTEWATGSNGQGIVISDTDTQRYLVYFSDTSNDKIIKLCEDLGQGTDGQVCSYPNT